MIREFLSGAGHWIVQVFIVVFISLSVDFAQTKIVKRLYKKICGKKHLWNDAILKALSTPLRLLIWVTGISFAAQIIEQETHATIFSAFTPLRSVGIIAAFAWFLLRLVTHAKENIIVAYEDKGKKVDVTTANALTKVLRASILVTTILVGLQTLGFSISGVLAFGGIGGIAIGFAAKDLLANFFGGFMIFWDRPFAVGDWIRSPDREIEGTVEAIGWRLTRIRTFAKRPLYIPNAVFSTIAVENPSRMTNRRIYETIGLRYSDSICIDKVLEEIRDMLNTHPEIDTKQTLMVNLNTFGDSSLDFFIYTFTKTTVWTRFHEIKEDVLLKIHNIITSHGAEVAFPTTTVELPEPMVQVPTTLPKASLPKPALES